MIPYKALPSPNYKQFLKIDQETFHKRYNV